MHNYQDLKLHLQGLSDDYSPDQSVVSAGILTPGQKPGIVDSRYFLHIRFVLPSLHYFRGRAINVTMEGYLSSENIDILPVNLPQAMSQMSLKQVLAQSQNRIASSGLDFREIATAAESSVLGWNAGSIIAGIWNRFRGIEAEQRIENRFVLSKHSPVGSITHLRVIENGKKAIRCSKRISQNSEMLRHLKTIPKRVLQVILQLQMEKETVDYICENYNIQIKNHTAPPTNKKYGDRPRLLLQLYLPTSIFENWGGDMKMNFVASVFSQNTDWRMIANHRIYPRKSIWNGNAVASKINLRRPASKITLEDILEKIKNGQPLSNAEKWLLDNFKKHFCF